MAETAAATVEGFFAENYDGDHVPRNDHMQGRTRETGCNLCGLK